MKEADLGGTGLVEPLYHYLWLKDRLNNNASLKMNLPDTVVYRNGKPCYWYFTATDGAIKRKCTESLTGDEIVRVFTKKATSNRADIVAVFMYAQKNINELYEINLRTEFISSGKGGLTADELESELWKTNEKRKSKKVIFEYLNKDGLEKFVKKDKKKFDGILQRFIEPKGENNCISLNLLVMK